MSATIPTAQPTPADPARLPADLFFDQVIQSVHRHEARARLAEQLTGQPFRYDLSSTASFTGLPVPLLRRLCRSGELQAVKHAGRWLSIATSSIAAGPRSDAAFSRRSAVYLPS